MAKKQTAPETNGRTTAAELLEKAKAERQVELQEFQRELDELCTKYRVRLQPQMQINVIDT